MYVFVIVSCQLIMKKRVRAALFVGVSRNGEGQTYVSAGRSLGRPLRTNAWSHETGLSLGVATA
jgi:hypothetical protein